IDVPQALATSPWETNSLFPQLDRERITIVRLGHRRWRERPLFRLPLLVLGVGESEAAIDALGDSDWYPQDETVREHGLRLRAVQAERVGRVFTDEPQDVVICPA